jgi:hypothetical protein
MTERVKVQKEYIRKKEYWVAQDFTLVPAFHCVRCKQPFTEHHEEAVNYQGFKFWYQRGSYSGLCPDCIRWYRTQDQSMLEPYCKVTLRFFDHGDHIVQVSDYIDIWPDGTQIHKNADFCAYEKQED